MSTVTLWKRSISRAIIALSFALGFGVVVGLLVKPATFHSDAIVEVTTRDPISRVAAMRAAIEDVVSKPVLLRAAAALSDMPAPRPDVFERMAVTLGLQGSHPTGRDGRLANRLKEEVDVIPGDLPGTIDISIRDPNANSATRLADAVVDAYIGDQDDRAADLRRRRETTLGARIDQLRASASAAHARLSALGGGADLAQIVALATNRRIEAQNRLDTVHAIMASGSPPLSDRKDLPDSIAALEKTYLDLSGQLLKARETLGERHTTIVSLKEGVARAATNLAAEWKRFERIARGELDAARARETDVRKTNPPVDASHQEAIDAARLTARQADERVMRAEATLSDTLDDAPSYRRLSRASAPIDSTGFSRRARVMIATGASLTLFAILAIVFGIRGKPVASERAYVVPHGGSLSLESDDQTDPRDEVEASPLHIEHRVRPKPPRKRRPRVGARDVKKARESIFAALEEVHPRYGISTIMIAANESDAESGPVALDLAYAIATSGRRVLLVEGPRSDPALAANIGLDAEPILVDLFSTLRVMFRSDAEQGILYVAPSFENEARITSVLARDGDTPLIDEIADEFDLLIFDGGRAGSVDMITDLYLRAGRFASPRADVQFLEAFGEPDAVFVGTMIENVFVPAEVTAMAPVDAKTTPREAAALPPLPPSRAPVARPRPARVERASTPLRRAGAHLF